MNSMNKSVPAMRNHRIDGSDRFLEVLLVLLQLGVLLPSKQTLENKDNGQ